MKDRKPGLDVIRALAILLVIFHHFRHLPGCPDWLYRLSIGGYVGVDFFFVLSGWLIGGQLTRNYRLTGRVDVLRFWVRRWFRTLPCYFFLLALLWGAGRISGGEVPHYSLFLQNYFSLVDRWLITWSLCVEEHFYIALPLLFLLLPFFIKSRTGWTVIILLFVAVSPFLRFLSSGLAQSSSYSNFITDFYAVTHFRLDGLAIGVALAVAAEYRTTFWALLEQHAGKMAMVGTILIMLSICHAEKELARQQTYFWVFEFLLVSLGTGLILPAASRLDIKHFAILPFIFISEHAYALYLTHDFVKSVISNNFPFLPFTVSFALALALSIISAIFLRNTIENPGLRARDWLLNKYSFRLDQPKVVRQILNFIGIGGNN